MDIMKSLTYMFEDRRWISKLLLGYLVSLVPILNFALTGYVTQTIQNVERKRPELLPEWDEFGKFFKNGFFMTVAGFVYSLPLIVISGLSVFPAYISENGWDSGQAVLAGAGILVGCLALLYALALSLILPAANINLARKETFESVFEIREFFRIIRENSSNYLTAWVMTLVWAIVVGILVSVLYVILVFVICVGWLAMFFVGAIVTVAVPLIYAHLFGQVAAKDAGVA
jgi:hypothetical protein